MVIPRPQGAPYFLPAGPEWNALAEGVRQAVVEILGPAYQRLVVEAGDELERSAGLTLVHLMRLEICDQTRLGVIAGDRRGLPALLQDPEEAIAQHLHLVAAKNSPGELMIRLRMVREMLQRGERLLAPPAVGPVLPPPTPLAPPTLAPPTPLAQTGASQGPGDYRLVGPDLTPPPEMCSGSEGPEIGKLPS